MYEKKQEHPDTPPPKKDDFSRDLPTWLLVGLSFIWSAPLGFLFLFLKLFGIKNCMQGVREIMSYGDPEFKGKTAQFQNDKKKESQNILSNFGQNISNTVQGKLNEVQQAQHKKYVQRKLRTYGKEQTYCFGVLTGIFTFAFLSSLPEDPNLALFLFSSGSAVATYQGFWKQKQANRMLQYLNITEGSKQFSVEKLQQLSSIPLQTISKDLEAMISMGLLKDAFLDRAHNTLVLENRDDYLSHYTTYAPSSSDSEEQDILQQIRGLNAQISNKKLSAQIDHIGMISSKILEFQEENNTKQRELHSFLSYYLPTTLKLLNSYRDLESQPISGENISKAKSQIEDMMDKIVEGFEKQLDQLFQHETLDIAADISVLEQMFQKDGLLFHTPPSDSSSNSDIQLKL